MGLPPRPAAAFVVKWRIRHATLPLRRPLIMGILNVTPDSFSDGGQHATPEQALRRALAMAEEGADLLDVGGVSTRPGAEPVSEAEELRRVLPVIRALRPRCPLPLSVDTQNARVAAAALDAGADILNDVSALADPGMARVAADAGAGVILMHCRGNPQTMSRQNVYADLPREVASELAERAAYALSQGIAKASLCLDPGFGFAKVGLQNFELLRGLEAVRALGYPVMVGASRKSFVGQVISASWATPPERVVPPFRPPSERLAGSLAFAVAAVWQGAHLLRVHDVAETCDAVRIAVQCGARTAGQDVTEGRGCELDGGR